MSLCRRLENWNPNVVLFRLSNIIIKLWIFVQIYIFVEKISPVILY